VKKLINDPKNVVRETFEGFVAMCFFPHKMTEDFSQFLSAKEEKAA